MDDHLLEMKQKLEAKEAKLLDVREPDEWEDGHLVAAELVPLSQLEQGVPPPPDVAKDTLLYLHCRSGNRVLIAEPILADMGYKNIIALVEGYEELCDHGFPATD